MQQDSNTVRISVGAHSFPRQARLLKPTEFKRVFDRPVISSDAFFRVLARANEGTGSRLGMAVSRRVDPRSSQRNRVKRVIRESFRVNHEATSEAGRRPGRDYVVLATPRSARASNLQLAESLSRHWQTLDAKLHSVADTDPRH